MTAMPTRTLRSGNKMPVLGLGTWQLTDDTRGTVAHALALGYRMIDTSGDYGTQPGIARAIRDSSTDREALYIVTKVEETDDAYRAVRHHLKELGLEYADLLLIHRPPPEGVGEGLWEGLARAREEGLTRDIGVSNYSIEQLRELSAAVGETPAVNQIEWTPFGYSKQMLEYCKESDVLIQAYSPLTRATRLDDETLSELAEHYGKSPAQMLIRWNLQLGTVPLPKANRRDHLKENFQVFDFQISGEDMAALNGLNEHFSSLGTLAYA